MPFFTKRPTVIGGNTARGDWTVSYKGREIGRVLPVGNQENVFMWSLNRCHPPAKGYCNSESKALDEIKAEVLSRSELVFPRTHYQKEYRVYVQ